jgi:HEAT repeat protein
MIHLLLIGALSAHAGPVGSIRRAEAKGKADALTQKLDHRSGYAREMAARALASIQPAPEATEALLACLSDPEELGFVRSACASTLASWKVKEAAPAMIQALSEVKGDDRYWMAEALHRLRSPEGRPVLAGLVDDSDIFLSASAREWSR